jgi:hypothetical protein
MYSAVWASEDQIPEDLTLTLHSSQWEEIPTPIHSEYRPNQEDPLKHASFRCLGLYININGTTQAQKDIFHEKLLKRCHKVIHSNASATIKWDAIKISLIPEIAYLANLTNWTLKKLEAIDTQINRIIKSILNAMMTQAKDLTYINQTVGGNGIKPFSEIIQTNKWGMYLRAARNTGPARHAAK